MKYRKVFIVGSPRSGTSWLLKLFLSHPSVVGFCLETKTYSIIGPFFKKHSKNENTCLEEISNNYKILFEKDSHFKNFLTEEELSNFISEIKSKKNEREDKFQLLIDFIFDNFFQKNVGNENKIFVEKTPNHIFYVDKILERYDDAKIIEIVRDGRNVCSSLEKCNLVGASWAPCERINQINLWKKYILKGIELRSNEKYRDKILMVKYEDLVKNKSKEIKKILNFVKLDYSNELLEKMISDNVKHANPSKIHTKPWIESFSEKDIELFNKEAGYLLQETKYTKKNYKIDKLKKIFESLKKIFWRNNLKNKPEIIVLVYQRPYHLKFILDALKRQTYNNFCITIINNNKKANAYLEKTVKHFSKLKIKLNHSQKNLWFGIRFQHAQRAKGNPIIFLDDDMIPRKDFVEYMMKEHNNFKGKFILGWHAHRFKSNYYWEKVKTKNHEQSDFIGCGSIIFDKTMLKDIPEMLHISEEAKKMDDIWLSFNAFKKGYKLIKIDKKIDIINDKLGTYLKIKDEKQKLFEKLIEKGWKFLKDKG